MIHRVGISMDREEMRRVRKLQKRFHIKSRSEFFRDLVHRYEKMEGEFTALQKCVAGYAAKPESSKNSMKILKASMRGASGEAW